MKIRLRITDISCLVGVMLVVSTLVSNAKSSSENLGNTTVSGIEAQRLSIAEAESGDLTKQYQIATSWKSADTEFQSARPDIDHSAAPTLEEPESRLIQSLQATGLMRCKGAEFILPEGILISPRPNANYNCTDDPTCTICPSYDKDFAINQVNTCNKNNVDLYHRGIDIFGAFRTPIYAAAGGEVTQIVEPVNSEVQARSVRIRHSNGLLTRYVHLDSVEPNIRVGGYVFPGQKIGTEGKSGGVPSSHLHFEVYRDGQYADPTPYFELDSPALLYSPDYTGFVAFTCADPEYLQPNVAIPPKDINLLLNGTFTSGIAVQDPIWKFENGENITLTNGIGMDGKLYVRGQGSFSQQIYYPTPRNSAFELSFRLNNTAGPGLYDETSGPRSITVEIYDLTKPDDQKKVASQRFSVPVEKANQERLYSMWLTLDSSAYNPDGTLIVDATGTPLWKPLKIQFYIDDISITEYYLILQRKVTQGRVE